MNAISRFVPETSNICRVGYALNAKKLRKGEDSVKEKTKNVHSSSDLVLNKSPGQECKKRTETSIWRGGGLADIISDGVEIEGVQFIPWDYEVPIHQQPTFQVIIHKLTEEIDRKEPSEKIVALQEYLRLHPATVIVDSFEAVHIVTSRARSCEALGRIIQRRHLGFSRPNMNIYPYDNATCCFSQPKFVVVRPEDHAAGPDKIMRMMSEAGFGFPVICKPVEACGTPNSHSMAVVVSASGLDLVRPPCIVQEYRDHGEIFFKVYVMGDEVMVFRRPSLPNLDALAWNQQNINREANESRRDRKDSNSSQRISPVICHNNSCSSDESKPENGDHVHRHDGSSIANPIGCTERYLGLRSVAFDSRFAYPTASDFIDPNFNAPLVNPLGHHDVISDAGSSSSSSSIATEVLAADHVVDGLSVLSNGCCDSSTVVTSKTIPYTPSSSSRTQSPLPIAVHVPSSGATSTTVSPTMMLMMPPPPGDNNGNSSNSSSSAVRRTSSILSSEGRARKPSGKDLPGVCLLHPLPTVPMATAFSSSTVGVDNATASASACMPIINNKGTDQSSSSAEEKAPLNGCNVIASRNNSTMIENGTKYSCTADNGKDNTHTATARDQQPQFQHQNSFDFGLSASSLGSLSQERFRAAAKAISEEFGLSLFGFDVIVPAPTSSHGLRHDVAMDSQSHKHAEGSQQLRSCGKNGICADSHNHVRSSSGVGDDSEGGVLSGGTCQSQSQERERGRSSSHNSDCGSIEKEIGAVSMMTAPSLDNFGGHDCHLVVIDVNFFPSYKEVPDFPQRLRHFLRKKAGMV